MPKCVKVEVQDDGKVMVGMYHAESEEQGGDYMKPAESVEAALERARGLLTADAGPKKPASMEEAMFGAAKPAKVADKAKA